MNCNCQDCIRENKIPMIAYAFSNSHCVISKWLRSKLE